MDRRFYHDLAARGLRMPVGTHLVLHEQPDPQAVELDGRRLGEVYLRAAERYATPLAVPLMDLTVEKDAMCELLGVPMQDAADFHFNGVPTDEMMAQVIDGAAKVQTPRMRANRDAIAMVAQRGGPDVVPVGMSIGPFSLLVKCVNDAITGLYLGGGGATAEDDDEVKAIERMLEMGMAIILASIRQQAQAGAKAIFLCEPAANRVYISPIQMEQGSNVFDRFVLSWNRQLKAELDRLGLDLILHDCGELTDPMIAQLATLDPVVMSLGSPRKLWEVEHLVPRTTVLFGNLPSKQFYSDQVMPLERVEQLTQELIDRMAAVKRPFILGSECDVLSVQGSAATIKQKVSAMLGCGGQGLSKGCGAGCGGA